MGPALHTNMTPVARFLPRSSGRDKVAPVAVAKGEFLGKQDKQDDWLPDSAPELGHVDALFWGALFRGIERGGAFLQLQIRQIIVAAIEDGRLPLGMRMPSSRDLASVLKVSRNTVVIAYEQLVDQNLLVSRQRSGYFVAGLPKRFSDNAGRPIEAASCDDQKWISRFALRPSAHRNIVKPADWQSYPYPFIFGQFDPSLFPTNDWRESARAALSVPEINNWARDLIDGDDRALIEQLQLQVLPRRGIHARSDEIMMTMGAQHALYLIAKLFVAPHTHVGIEDPGYPDARNIFRMLTPNVAPLPIDNQGLTADQGFAGCTLDLCHGESPMSDRCDDAFAAAAGAFKGRAGKRDHSRRG